MIILRTKQYSKATKLMAGFKKVANAGMTKLDNAGLKAGNAVKQVFTGKAPSYGVKQGFAPKTAMQVKRDAVKAVQDVKNAPAEYALKAHKVAAMPVGEAANKGIKTIIRRPDYAAVAIASEASTPLGMSMGGTVGKVLMAPWGTPVMKALEKHPLVPKKLAPTLDRAAEKYGKSKMAATLRKDRTTFGDLAMNAHNFIPL